MSDFSIDDIRNVFSNNEINDFLIEYQKKIAEIPEYELGFNVFSLVSDTYYKENLHSDILYKILDPKSNHGEKDLFLKLFLNYLIESGCIKIDIENYKNPLVDREKGRIDISVYDNETKHFIIIENKIHDAPDTNYQIPDYYNKIKNKGYNIDAIPYISKDGKKEPDRSTWKESSKDINELIVKLCAFDDDKNKPSLYKWLVNCKNESKNDNNRFILEQYAQLLKHLRRFEMKMKNIEELYSLMNESKETADKIWNLNNAIVYFPEKVSEKVSF